MRGRTLRTEHEQGVFIITTANLHPAIMHTALIRIGGTDKLELGFVVRGERYLVVGVQTSRNGDAPPSRP